MESDSDIRERLCDPHALVTVREMGHGAFGTVYLMEDPADKRRYAVKTEPEDSQVPQLQYEFRVYRKLRGTRGVPLAYALWNHDGKVHMAMQPLGPSLERVMRDITQFDVMRWLFVRMLDAVQGLHDKGFLHRDIKPENFLLGATGIQGKEVYLVDYGLCKRYRMSSTDHIPYKEGKRLTGTVRYASVHVHLGEEQSRRDDLESLGYVGVFLIKRKLPWMGLGGKDKGEMHQRVMTAKVHCSSEDLCEGLPVAFLQFFRHVRSLTFDASPDYALLRSFFTANLL